MVEDTRRLALDERLEVSLVLLQCASNEGDVATFLPLVREPLVESEETHVDRVGVDLDRYLFRTTSSE